MSEVDDLVSPHRPFGPSSRSRQRAGDGDQQGAADVKLVPAQPVLPDDLGREVYCVLGLPIDVVDMAEALRRIEAAAASSVPYLISTPNLNFLVNSRYDTEFRDSIIDSDLCPPDGMPIVWIARMLGLPISQRVAGSDIFDSLKKRYTAQPLKTFLFGGAAGIAAMVARALNAKPLGLCCVGSFYPGYGTVDLMSTDEILETINRSRADFLAVALSAAKGQTWLYRNRGRLQVPIRAQLGAAINFQAGTLNRAPALVQKLGLEWLWRIKEEPHLWKRYARDGLSLVALVLTRVLPLAMLQRWQRATASPGGKGLHTICRYDHGVVTVQFSGSATAAHVDVAAERLREALAGTGTVAIDMAETTRVDARFLGLLLMARKVAGSRNIRLIITRVSNNTKRLFHLNGADFLLPSGGGKFFDVSGNR